MQRNPAIPYTYNYSQPFEYRFSIDSIEMAWAVAQDLSQSFSTNLEKLAELRTLDLCAGCGVIGFELNFHLPRLNQIDFVEVQNIYKEHFEANRQLVQNQGSYRFLEMNYEQLLSPEFQNRFQVIVCNPPYFQLEQGKLSPSEFKNRCRFYMDSTFEKLIQSIDHCLSQEGQAYLLLRSLEDHGFDVLKDLREMIRGKLNCENVAMIRGTFLLKLYR